MEQLPPHVALVDEPIPAPFGDRYDGPDLRSARSIPELIEELDRIAADDDVVGYLECFRAQLDEVGIDISVVIERDGIEHLMVGSRCDAQVRHRSRWIHFLFEHFNCDPERRTLLLRQLRRRGHFADNRPANPGQTTAAIRDFLENDGRILIDPQGQLAEGGGIPRPLVTGSSEEAAACIRAGRAYFEVRRRWRSDRQIKRAVRMLGERTDNGWIVLEARS